MLRVLLILPLLAGPAFAQGLQDQSLTVIPRTKAEAARIAGVLAAPKDFSASERFEAKPGGAATVRARPTADAFSQYSGNMPFDRQMNFKLVNA